MISQLNTRRGNAFPKSRRILRRSDFLRVQSSPKKARTPHFLLAAVSAPIPESRSEEPTLKLGITITTKVHKRAVRRNYLRRRIRELFRNHLIILPGRHTELVVIALNGACELTFKQIRSELCELVRRARLERLLKGCEK